METCTVRKKTWTARLAANFDDIPLLFPPLRHIIFELRYAAFEVASFSGFVYALVQLWKHF
jgi:hypothetical protein